MAYDAHKNFAYSTIATGPSPASSGGSLVVFAGDGTKFPAASFNATVWPANTQPTTANAEIVRVTVVATDTFTITRAQESSSARAIVVGDQIAATITAKTLTDVEGFVSSAGYGICGGRLTLTAGTPVTTGDVTGATSVVFTPYGVGDGNIGLFDGASTWTILPFVETSIALGTLTATLPYDVFAYNNSGTLALELLAWTSTSARATALALQNGVLVKTGATTRRYLGTFVTTSTTQTEDSLANRLLFSYYNRVKKDFLKSDATASWSIATSATIRQVRAQAANQVTVCVGVAETLVDVDYSVVGQQDQAGANAVKIGIGLDSTTAFASNQVGNTVLINGVNAQVTGFCRAILKPAAGYHTVTMLEAGNSSATVTFYGTGTYTNSAMLVGTCEV